jgi:glycosyltransferase involved in cell wall biosynthesis
MRILHIVASEKWTGAAAVVWDWTQALGAAGVEVQLACVAESPLSRRLLPEGSVRPLLSHAHGPVGLFSDLRRLSETLLRERFDLVHAHLSHDHYLAAAAVRATPARLVRTLHHVNQARSDPATRILFRRTSAFSYANAQIAARCRVPGPVHSPIVDPARFAPGQKPGALLERLGAPRPCFIAGTVGKISRGRGHEEAVDAAARVDGAVLLHVGKGPHQSALQERARRLQTAQRNLWAGYQEETLPDLYRGMDVFLFTASGSQQGQRAVLEAMASGLPVVALPVPGVADLLTDGAEGFIVPDVAGLADALRRLQSDDALRRRLGEAGRRRALEFTARKFAAHAIAFYEEILRAS